MEQFLGGLQILLNWQNFLIIPVGLVIGIVVGAIPGLTSDLGIILCIPSKPSSHKKGFCWAHIESVLLTGQGYDVPLLREMPIHRPF